MNGLTLAVSIFATVSYISGEKLEGAGLTMGITPDEAKRFGYDEPQTKSDLVAARAMLAGTPMSEVIPSQKKGAKLDAKLVLEARKQLVYFLSARGNAKGTATERNRVVMAIACLGFTTLAEQLAEKTNPVRIDVDGDTLVVDAPRSEDFKYHCRKNGWSYHGDGQDPKFAKYAPYTNRTTGEVMTHVRTIPLSDEAKLLAALDDAFKGRVVLRDNGGQGKTFRFISPT